MSVVKPHLFSTEGQHEYLLRQEIAELKAEVQRLLKLLAVETEPCA
jgi:hypothetical protein